MKFGKFLFFSLLACKLFGTAQIPDILIYNGDTLMLHSTPLEFYEDGKFSNPKTLFKSSGCTYTACYRNYIATWEVINNEIYLVELKNSCYPTALKGVQASFKVNPNLEDLGVEFANLRILFPTKYKEGRVKADWINFELICPYGALIEYIHSGFDSIYEYELGLEVKDGKINKLNRYDNSKSKKSIFTLNNDSLFNFLYQNIDWNIIEQSNKDSIRVVIATFEIDKTSKPTKIEVKYRKANEIIDKEIVRVVGLIPEWDIMYRNGKVIKMRWNLPVNLNKEFYIKRNKNKGG